MVLAAVFRPLMVLAVFGDAVAAGSEGVSLANPRTCLGTPTYAMVAMPAVLASFSLIPPGCGSGPLHDVRLLFDAHLGGVVGLANLVHLPRWHAD